MRYSFVFLIFTCVLFAQKTIFSSEHCKITDYDFFHTVSQNEWALFDSSKKNLHFNDFIKKELAVCDAFYNWLNFDPSVFIKLYDRKKQILINNYYESVVVSRLIDKEYYDLTFNNLPRRVFAHHILLGYKGCSLSGDFVLEKAQVFDKSVDIKKQLSVELKGFSNIGEKTGVFGASALSFSEDPSVEKNLGSLGWVSWGRVVPSFQNVAFSLLPGEVSDPVLTDYGYHLIFVEKEGFSDFKYYNPSLRGGFSQKLALQGVSFDSLKNTSVLHDSLILKEGGLKFNNLYVDSLLVLLSEEIKKESFRPNKHSYLSFFKNPLPENVLFVFKGKGYGLGWFVDFLEKTPSTRVSPIKNSYDLKTLISSQIIQKEAVSLALKNKVDENSFFMFDFSKHEKNILFNEYVKSLIKKIPPVDSSLVFSAYNAGVSSKKKYISPEKVVISEFRVFDKLLAEGVYSEFVAAGSFDFVLKKHSEHFLLNKQILGGTGGVLGETAFNLKVGDTSFLIENTDKSFSFFRVEDKIPSSPLSLKNVYSQIERKVLKQQQDSIKTFLHDSLVDKFGFFYNCLEL